MFALRRHVFVAQIVVLSQQSADRQSQKQEAQSREDHRGGIQRDRKRVRALLDNVGGEEGKQRRREEKAEVGVQHAVIAMLHAVGSGGDD